MDKRRDEPDAREALRWQWLSGNIVHRDQWVDLRENTYLLPNGKEITPYYTTRNRNFSVIVARDPEGSYICVRQFRPGTETVTTEFPAGGMEEGEDPLSAAKRELLEETGYEAEQWTALGRIAPNATIANNYAYIFLAEGCRKVSGRHLDATECMETAVLSAGIMEEMIAECRVIQAVHVAAYYMAREKQREADAGREKCRREADAGREKCRREADAGREKCRREADAGREKCRREADAGREKCRREV